MLFMLSSFSEGRLSFNRDLKAGTRSAGDLGNETGLRDGESSFHRQGVSWDRQRPSHFPSTLCPYLNIPSQNAGLVN